MYMGVGEWEGVVGVGGRLYLSIGLFEVAMSPRITSHMPRQAWRA